MNKGSITKTTALLLLYAIFANPVFGMFSAPNAMQKYSKKGSIIPISKLYISTTGSDKNTGTKDRPLATIDKAKQIVRTIKGPVIVYLRKGTYHLSKPIIFDRRDSRKKNEAVTYTSYDAETVILSGAHKIKLQWTLYKEKIVQAKVKDNIIFDQLFVNGQQQRMARYPNFNAAIKQFGGFAADALSEERIKSWKEPAGGFIHSLHRSEWGGFNFLITGKNNKGQLLMTGGFQNNRPSEMHQQIRFVENIFEELDTAGEYYFDLAKRILYYYQADTSDIHHASIEAPQLESLLEFRGTEKEPVKNITVSGLQFTQTLRTFMKNKEPLLRSDWTIYRKGAVTLTGTVNCTIKQCYFNSVGGNAIVFSNFNRKNTVIGCRIDKSGSSAVVFVGDPAAVRSPLFKYEQTNDPDKIDLISGPKTNNYPADCLVYNNLIENIGQTEKQVAGVEISMSAYITVSHNTIDNVPRAGINVSEGTWGGHIIENNDIFNTVLETGDHGSFNSWGRDRYWISDRKRLDSLVSAQPAMILLDILKPIIIRNNRFRCDHGWDIDLDDGSSLYEIYNNVLLNGGLKLREGFYRHASNNIIINNSLHPHVWFKNSGDIFKNNIISAGYFPIGIEEWGKEVDYNLFPDSVSLNEAKRNGTDMHSAYGDPLFVNPSEGDYRVKENSPALKIGFKNFSMVKFGVVSADLRAIAQKISLPVIISGTHKKGNEIYEFLGAKVKNLTTLGERSATGMDSETGVLLLSVPQSSILYGKLIPNDVILAYSGKEIKNISDLIKENAAQQLNHTAPLVIFRNQQVVKFTIELK